MYTSLLLKAGLLSLPFLTAAIGTTQISEEVSSHIDITKNGNILSNAEFSINCVSCSAVGDLSFSGGCDGETCVEQWAPDANFSMLPFDFTEYWVGVAFDDFTIHIELDINLTPSQPTNEIVIPLIGSSGLNIPFNRGGIFDTVFTFNPQLHGWVNSSSLANFTYGFDVVIPPHSAIWIPVLHQDNITAIGFNETTLSPTNFTSSNPNLTFDFQLSFRPLISLQAQFLHDIFNGAVSLFADIPSVTLAVTQAFNVTNDCEVPAAGTDPSHIYKNLTHVQPSVGYDIDVALDKNVLTLWGETTALATSCLDYEAKVTGLVTAPAVNPASGAGRPVVEFATRWLVALLVGAVLMG